MNQYGFPVFPRLLALPARAGGHDVALHGLVACRAMVRTTEAPNAADDDARVNVYPAAMKACMPQPVRLPQAAATTGS